MSEHEFRFDPALGMFREGQFTGSPESSGDYIEDLLALKHATRRMLRALDRLAYGRAPVSMKYERYARAVAVYRGRHEQVARLLEEDGRA